MAEPELWAFVLANAGLFVASSVLTGLSYLAYRRSGGRSSYRFAVVGFGLVVLGGLVEPLYQLLVRGDYTITGRELLVLQTGEGVLIAAGLGTLFYGILHHRAGPTDGVDPAGERAEYTYKVGENDD